MRFPAVRALLVLCLSSVFLGLAAPAALAHDSLKSSSPAKNATVSGLDRIELEFSAHVSFPVVILHDAAGRRYESGSPRTDGPKVVQDVAATLPPGGYVIAWRIVSSDGHPVEGEIPFTVAGTGGAQPAASASGTGAAPAPAESAAPAAPAAATQAGGIPGWVWAGLGLLVVIAAVTLLGGRKKPEEAAGREADA
ncbi:copper resistance CopC family protein [Sphaerisporangium corydalis]|uniref:Copper resistance protein CopC n=1 Tax=Sphaerisporangium corydalis TaxID=1441875 RepID=A0ABV9EMC6_9ACTN|nr:copper resistance CopC family protein [Sphaerisporangium corydalis]